MKTVFMAAALLAALSVGAPGWALAPGEGLSAEVGHGGGCRKDSPPGRCCHAGSKPYHCH
ncbi:MAG: hypothetical protein ACU0DT_00500 [Albimonas sp.]|uniref:hypothetical protein n=1 Tax=Albimonas sp. TaxID=1872425 RepID=UPI00405625CF|tara:strand:+ start:404 stop:583 length:180 start_codon:yes stop_codon:yes gene_type:complete